MFLTPELKHTKKRILLKDNKLKDNYYNNAVFAKHKPIYFMLYIIVFQISAPPPFREGRLKVAGHLFESLRCIN